MATAGSKLVLPMVVLNMGGEMVYILHQRLNAQKVEEDKKSAVLRDVICTMYAPQVRPRISRFSKDARVTDQRRRHDVS